MLVGITGAPTDDKCQWLLDGLQQMGERMLTVHRTRRDPRDAELAEQLTRAEGWARVDELRIPVDMSPAEAVALAMTVNLEAGLRLLSEYPSSQ
jgi:hypothetical protein